jgi:hypothetical protein
MILAIDQSKDYSNRELYSYLSGVSIPEFVKQASLDDIKADPKKVERTAFADGYNTFPIHKKAAAFISAVYFLNKHNELKVVKGERYVQKVATELDQAAKIYGIQKDISDYAIDMLTKAAALEPQDQSISVMAGGSEIELFTIKTAADLNEQSNWFVNKLNNYPVEWRRDIADQFVKAAELLGVDELPDLILKYAGYYYPNVSAVREEMSRRATKLSDQNKERYQKLAADIENFQSKDDYFKLAEICYYTEKTAGLYDNHKISKILGDPVDKIFTLSFEKVAELLDTVRMGGSRYQVEDLEKVSNDVYEKAFGFEKPASADEMKDILPTMPLGDVSLFVKLSGIKAI